MRCYLVAVCGSVLPFERVLSQAERVANLLYRAVAHPLLYEPFCIGNALAVRQAVAVIDLIIAHTVNNDGASGEPLFFC